MQRAKAHTIMFVRFAGLTWPNCNKIVGSVHRVGLAKNTSIAARSLGAPHQADGVTAIDLSTPHSV
jgi:hypothetical protein